MKNLVLIAFLALGAAVWIHHSQAPLQAEDLENRRLLDTIIAGGRVYLSGTMLDDAFALRVSILSHRTHHRQIEDFFSELDRALNEVRPDTT